MYYSTLPILGLWRMGVCSKTHTHGCVAGPQRQKYFKATVSMCFPFLVLSSFSRRSQPNDEIQESKANKVLHEKSFLSSRPSHVTVSMGFGTNPHAKNGNIFVVFCTF